MLAGAIALLVLAVPVGAQGSCGMGMNRGNGMMGMSGGMNGMCGDMAGMSSCLMMQGSPVPVMMMLNNLDLTDTQWDEIEAIMVDANEQIVTASEDAGLINPPLAFIQVFANPTLTVSALEDFADRATSLSDLISGIQNETLVKVHDVLTADQLEELVAFASSSSDRDGMSPSGYGMGHMGGMGRMGGGCGRGMR